MRRMINPRDEQDVRFLLTTDHGSWVAVTRDEWNYILQGNLDDNLFLMLEEKGIILTRNNEKRIISDYKERFHFLFHGTTLHILLSTLRCNKTCIYCHSSVKATSAKEYDMDEETADATLDFIFQTPSSMFTIEFQGGETLLNYGLFQYIVLKAKRMAKEQGKKVNFSLVTNLTLMNDTYLEWIVKEGIDICTSLDGPKFVHDKNRQFEGGKPTHDIIAKKIMHLRKKGAEVGMLMVTTRHSLKYWKEIVDEYVTLGAKVIQLRYINKLGFAADKWDEQAYTIQEFTEFWKKGVDYMIELCKKGVFIKERYVQIILQKLLNKHDPSFTDFRSPCGIVAGQIAYNFNGDIYSCDEGRNFDIFHLGNVKTSKYAQVLSSTQSQQLIASSMNDNLICDNCAYKTWCGTCVVMNYAEEGSVVPKIPTNTHHILFEMMFDYVFEKLIFDEEAKKVLLTWK